MQGYISLNGMPDVFCPLLKQSVEQVCVWVLLHYPMQKVAVWDKDLNEHQLDVWGEKLWRNKVFLQCDSGKKTRQSLTKSEIQLMIKARMFCESKSRKEMSPVYCITYMNFYSVPEIKHGTWEPMNDLMFPLQWPAYNILGSFGCQ